MTQWRNGVSGARKARLRAEPRVCGRVEEFGKGPPVPGDAAVEYLERDALDIDQVAHRDLARLGLARRDADAAIAHHDRGDAVPRGRADRRVPADLRVVMRVRVDKAGRDDSAGRIDDFRRAVADPADLGDLAILDRDIGLAPLRAGAVDHGAVLDQQIVGHRHISISSDGFSIVIRTARVKCKKAAQPAILAI